MISLLFYHGERREEKKERGVERERVREGEREREMRERI